MNTRRKVCYATAIVSTVVLAVLLYFFGESKDFGLSIVAMLLGLTVGFSVVTVLIDLACLALTDHGHPLLDD